MTCTITVHPEQCRSYTVALRTHTSSASTASQSAYQHSSMYLHSSSTYLGKSLSKSGPVWCKPKLFKTIIWMRKLLHRVVKQLEKVFFFFFFIGVWLIYNVVLVSNVQQVIHIFTLFRFLSHIGHCRVLSRVLCVIPTKQVLISYLFYIQQYVYTHSSIVAWRIPGMEDPGGLPSIGSHRVGHD